MKSKKEIQHTLYTRTNTRQEYRENSRLTKHDRKLKMKGCNPCTMWILNGIGNCALGAHSLNIFHTNLQRLERRHYGQQARTFEARVPSLIAW